jgi:single-strand DNA-binding protein
MTSAITIVGNLTADPELKFTNSGQAQTRFSVAVNRKFKETETTSFFNVTAWGSLAENLANSVHKGTRVIVEGRLEQRSWETDKGEKRSTVEISANSVGTDLRFNVVSVQNGISGGQGTGRAPAPKAEFEDLF